MGFGSSSSRIWAARLPNVIPQGDRIGFCQRVTPGSSDLSWSDRGAELMSRLSGRYRYSGESRSLARFLIDGAPWRRRIKRRACSSTF